MTAKGYWVSTYRSVSDPERLAAYAALAGPALRAAGGRFLVRGGQQTVYEAGLAERTVVVEFDSYQRAVAAYRTPEYQKALEVLGDAAVRDIRIVEGAS